MRLYYFRQSSYCDCYNHASHPWSSLTPTQVIPHTCPSHPSHQGSKLKINLLVGGTGSPKIYLSERLRARPDLLATDQLNYQLILQNLSWGQVPFKSTCPPPFLLVPDNRTICFFEP